MEATGDRGQSAPQAAISKSFAVGAAGKDQQADSNGAGAGAQPPSKNGDILLEDSEDRNPRVDGQSDGRIPIRAPLTDSAEDIADGEGSSGSGESFDSALEGMAASSTTSNDAFASPKGSPDRSFSASGVLAGMDASSSQQGALMRLNELNNGVSSLDAALISGSRTEEEFKDRVAQIARKNDLSADDTVVKNILDLLIPLVLDAHRLSVNEDGFADKSGAKNEERPVAKVTSENDDDPESNNDEDDSLYDEPDGEDDEAVQNQPDSQDLPEDDPEIHGTLSAQGLPVVGANEVELEEASAPQIPRSELVQDTTIVDKGTSDAKMDFGEAKINAKTEASAPEHDVQTNIDLHRGDDSVSAPAHDDQTITKLDEGKVDATCESAVPMEVDKTTTDLIEGKDATITHGDQTETVLEEGKVDAITGAPAHRIKTELEEGEVDATVESAAPVDAGKETTELNEGKDATIAQSTVPGHVDQTETVLEDGKVDDITAARVHDDGIETEFDEGKVDPTVQSAALVDANKKTTDLNEGKDAAITESTVLVHDDQTETKVEEGKVDAMTAAQWHDDRIKTEFDEGKVDPSTEPLAPVHDQIKTEPSQGELDARTESVAPVYEDQTRTELDEGKAGAITESLTPVCDDLTKPGPGEGKIDATIHSIEPLDKEPAQILPEAYLYQGGDDTKLKMDEETVGSEESATKTEKGAEKVAEQEVHSESEQAQGSASESSNAEIQNLPKEESEAQKPKEEELQKLREEDSEQEKEDNQHSDPQQQPQKDISESEKTKGESAKNQEPEPGVQTTPELAAMRNTVDSENGNQLQSEQHLEGDSESDKAKGNLCESDHAISSEPDGLLESHGEPKKEVVQSDAIEGKAGADEVVLADLVRSVTTTPISTEDTKKLDLVSEDTQASAGIELENGKVKGDMANDKDEEFVTPKIASNELTPAEIKSGSPLQDFAIESTRDSVNLDHQVKETEAVKKGDEPETEEILKPKAREDERSDVLVDDRQTEIEGPMLSKRNISGGSESIEEEPEGDLRSATEEKINRGLSEVVQVQESLEDGDVSGIVGDRAETLEQFQPKDGANFKNQSTVDTFNPLSAFKDEDDDEEDEDSYWNEKEINDEDDDEDEDEALQRSAALAALVRAVDASGGGTGTPSLGSAGPSLPARPAGLGRSMPSLEPVPRAALQPSSNGVAASRSISSENNQPNGEANDSNSETRQKLQAIRVKFLRLAHRLGQSAQNVVVAQVLYRLGLAEQLRGGSQSASRSSAFSFDRASAIAEEQEATGQEELDFSCTIMLLGKTGVGKSATINSIFDEVKAPTNAFTFATKKVQEITGTVHGIKLRVIDTPGLLPSVADQRQNEKIMASVKRFIKKSPPDIVLYFDRLDMQTRDFGDIPLLRTITDTFGAAIWFNAIVVLTHASSAPPDGPNGVPVSYEMFVAQRSHVIQQTIRQAAGDTRLMNPVSLVENHVACRTNRAGERVLPNGQVWKPQLLLLSFASKILAEANALLKLQESTPGKPFATRSRVPPLPFLLSSLLQSRAQLKMPEEQMGDEDISDDEEEADDSDDEIEYDDLPPFRRLSRDEIEELDKEQRRLYFEELDDREKLFQKKQWKEELKRRKERKKRMGNAAKGDLPPPEEGYDEDGGRSAAVPVALPDMALPPSFDSDNPSHRYRYLETASQWLVRPVLETHGWDHDCGYDGLNVEKIFIVGNKVPVSLSGQITKDKKEANVTLESAASLRHGEGKSTLAAIDIQTMGKDLSYTLRSETRFNNFKHNKTIAGLAITMLGDTIAAGLKLEDRLSLGKRLKLVMNGGAITGRKDVAYGGTLEISLRDQDYPIGRNLSTLGLSVMDWHGDLAIGGNFQSQFAVGKTTLIARANLNNRRAGQISLRASSSEQIQMALIGVIPIIRALFGNRLFSSSHST